MVDDLARNIEVVCVYKKTAIPCVVEMQTAGQTLRLRVYHALIWHSFEPWYPIHMPFTPIPLIDEVWILNTKTGLGISYQLQDAVTIMPIELVIDLQRWLF